MHDNDGTLPQQAQPAPAWASGAAYEPFMGRWSRQVARIFIAWLAVPPGGAWLDVGCGTGALTQTILKEAAPRSVLGIDPSEAYIAYVREHVPDARAHFVGGDAIALPADSGAFAAVVSGLSLNFVPDLARAVAEMARVAAPAGTIAAYVWDYAGQMQFLRYYWDAAAALNPLARELDEGRRFPICQPEPLAALFAGAGLRLVEARAIDSATHFASFDEYWQPFLGGQGPAPGYVVSLDPPRQIALRERLRATLPIAADGALRLVARAWAVRAVAPVAPSGPL